MFLDNAVADAQAKASSLSDALGRIKRIEYSVRFLDSGPTVVDFGDDASFFRANRNLQRAFVLAFEHSVNGVIDYIQKHLLQLVGICYHGRQAGFDFVLQGDATYFQVVVAQQQSLFEHLADIYLIMLRFALASEREQVLHYSMCALGLLEQFAYKIACPFIQPFALQQLRITENGGQRIIKFVGYARDELAYSGHFFTLQQLFLGASQVFISTAGFFIEFDFFYGG